MTPYPYLLRDRPAMAPNEAWSTDSRYVPMTQGFLYLTAVLDWHSRYVLSWELSNTLDVGFCLQALSIALRQAPAPYIFNSDHGSQFTCPTFEQALLDAGCRISRDERGRATDSLHQVPLVHSQMGAHPPQSRRRQPLETPLFNRVLLNRLSFKSASLK
jgi:putative transposase